MISVAGRLDGDPSEYIFICFEHCRILLVYAIFDFGGQLDMKLLFNAVVDSC